MQNVETISSLLEKILNSDCGNWRFKTEELEALAELLGVSGKCLNSLRNIVNVYL